MKNIWGSNLGSTLTNAAGALKQMGAAAAAPRSADAGSPSEGSERAAPPEKQYLRLPLESAKKLRWYDKVDLQALVRSHTREKRELLDTIHALKRIIIRTGGLTESELDEEVKQLLAHVQDMAETDEGVNSVLIISVQAELTELQERHDQLQKDADALNAQLLGARPHVEPHFSLGSELGCEYKGASASAETAKLAENLSKAMEEFEHYMAATTSLHKQIRRCEGDISLAEALEAVKSMENGAASSSAGGPSEVSSSAPSPVGHAAVLAKLQRLETERLQHDEELAEMSKQMARLQDLAGEEKKLRGRLEESEERGAALSSVIDSLRAELLAASAGQRAAEDALDRKVAEMKRMQQTQASADALRKYQDICLEAEERASVAAKKVAIAEARSSKLEASLKESQAEVKKVEKSLLASQCEQGVLMQRLAKLESLTMSTRAVEDERRSEAVNKKLADQMVAADDLQRSLRQEVATLSNALKTAEQRCQATEAREGRLMAELREAELVAHDREELYAQVMLLRDKLSEQRAEKGQAEQYKQMVQELEAGRTRLEEELMATAQLVTQLEGRLREVIQKVDSSEMAVQVAEKRAFEAEAAVAAEVELRMAAACSSRAFWPAPIRDEVARMEQRLSAMQGSLVAAEARLASEKEVLDAEILQKVEYQQELANLQERMVHMEGLLGAKLSEIEELQGEVEKARVNVLRLEVEKDELERRAENAINLARVQSSGQGADPNGADSSGVKWQVQNRVGGGGLYGVTDNKPALQSAGSTSSLTASEGGSTHGATPRRHSKVPECVDILYLKNVLLKFLEASVTGKVAERDVLLPAVATLLQATPAEFAVLKKLLHNTAPPANQMLSLFGNFKI